MSRATTELRLAGAEDNPVLLEFMAEHAMSGAMAMRFDRSPDYLALPKLHSSRFEVWMLERANKLKGVGTIVIRPGYINQHQKNIAYLGDLRVAPERGIAGQWRQMLIERLRELRRNAHLEHQFCAVMRNNRRALNALFNGRKQSALRFEHLRGYANVSLLGRKPWRKTKAPNIQIRKAQPVDSEPLRQFLDRESKAQAFGVVFDEATWRRRLETWPDFGVENFYLAERENGQLVGCLAPWDARRVRRIVIERGTPAMRAIASVFNLAAPFVSRPPVDLTGKSSLKDIYLTHVQVSRRDPAVFRALLNRVFKDLIATRRFSTVSLCLFDDDPLASTIDDYFSVSVPMDLYAIAIDDQRAMEPTTVVPGFEIYLV